MLRMRMAWVAQYHGPNPLACGPVVVAELMAALEPDPDSVALAGERVWVCSGMSRPEPWPDLSDAASTRDGLLDLGHSAVCWAREALNEIRGDVRDAGALRVGDRVRVWLGFHRPEVSRDALQLALRVWIQAIQGQLDAAVFKAELDRLWASCRRHHPDYQASILMRGARELNVPYFPFLPDTKFWQFGWGAAGQVFMESASNLDGALGMQWQRNKVTSKKLMDAIGLPTAAHVLVSLAEELPAAVRAVGYPCVVKPLDKGGGKGVTAHITHAAQLQQAFGHARNFTQGAVMVEAHLSGHDHRLMVIHGELVAVIRREPSFVVGDGQKTLAMLLAELNAPRSGNMVRSRYLRPIPADDVLIRHLAEQSLTLSDVPAAGQRVTLRSNANLSTGGMCTDVTAQCHPDLRAMAEQLAQTCGLYCAGIDYLTTDITRSPHETGGAFIELNTTPGLDACIAAGWSQSSIASLVLGRSAGRIPVTLTVLHPSQIAEVLAGISSVELGPDEAWVCADVLRIGARTAPVVGDKPWAAVMAALRNRCVKALHVVCSSQDIAKNGLPLDFWDVVRVAQHEDVAVLPSTWMQVLQRHCRSDSVSVVHEKVLNGPWTSDNFHVNTGTP